MDTHIHLAAAPSVRTLIKFMRKKVTEEGDTVVMPDGRTLVDVMPVTAAGITADKLQVR